MDATSVPFIQGIEVWIPDGNLLQRQSCAYKQETQLEAASSALTLRKGQGLPGLAWSSGKPEVWHELGNEGGTRPEGLDAAVALPIFRGSEVVAVVVFLCGSSEQTGGCIEVWEPNEHRQLTHLDGYYGRLRAFEEISRAMVFVRGQGLPGLTWERRSPQIIDDVATSISFLRAQAARECDVHSGLGIPVFRGGIISHVMLFLSAQSTPLARAFEVWVPDDDDRLQLRQSFYAPGLEEFGSASRSTVFEAGVGLPGRVFDTGLPHVVDCARADLFARHRVAREAGLEVALGLPIHDGFGVRAVVLMIC
jgi:hypothetical protein